MPGGRETDGRWAMRPALVGHAAGRLGGGAVPATAIVTTAPAAGSLPARAAECRIPLLSVDGLSVHFGGLKAVDEVSLEVREGEIVALIGPNGAGKTTLFNAVSRLQKLTAGTVHFAGQDVTKLSTANTARLGMARTFQNLRIYVNMTVLENVLVGCHRHERSGLWAGGLGLPHQRREEKASRERAMQRSGRGGTGRPSLSTRRQPALRVATPGGDRPRSGLRAPPASAGRAGGRYERGRARPSGRTDP